MQRGYSDDLSNETFPGLTAQESKIGESPSIAMRVNYVGELGWELNHPIASQNQIFDELFEAGND